jgi:hypothetical protein
MYDLYYGNQTLPSNAKILAKIESEQDIDNNLAAVSAFECNSKHSKKVAPSLRYAKKNGWHSVVIVEINAG